MDDYLTAMLEITAAAEAIPRRYFKQALAVDTKQDATPVTRADRETEDHIRTAISRRFPDHSILGEEFGERLAESRYHWVIDPIDGTRAFISGMPLFGMLVGLLEDGVPVRGVVRMPGLGEVYAAGPEGAFLNGDHRLGASGTTDLGRAFLYINEADKLLAAVPEVFHRLNAAGRDRRFAYDCYPHMLVASGRIDACVDFDLKPYDYLPLVPIVEAAGGVISDWAGAPLGLGSDGRVVTAATPALHAELLQLLN